MTDAGQRARDVSYDLYAWKAPRDLEPDEAQAMLKIWSDEGARPERQPIRAEQRYRLVLPRADDGPARTRCIVGRRAGHQYGASLGGNGGAHVAGCQRQGTSTAAVSGR